MITIEIKSKSGEFGVKSEFDGKKVVIKIDDPANGVEVHDDDVNLSDEVIDDEKSLEKFTRNWLVWNYRERGLDKFTLANLLFDLGIIIEINEEGDEYFIGKTTEFYNNITKVDIIEKTFKSAKIAKDYIDKVEEKEREKYGCYQLSNNQASSPEYTIFTLPVSIY